MKIDIWVVLENRMRNFNFHWNLARIAGILHADRWIFLVRSRSVLLIIRKCTTKVVEEIKTHILCSITFFLSCRLWDEGEKYCRAGQATEDNMARAHCMLVTKSYKHTLRTCDTYCFSTSTMVTRTHLHVPLPAHCLFCSWLRNQDAYCLSSCLPHNPRSMAVSVMPKQFLIVPFLVHKPKYGYNISLSCVTRCRNMPG
jgi:hypothetical protein